MDYFFIAIDLFLSALVLMYANGYSASTLEAKRFLPVEAIVIKADRSSSYSAMRKRTDVDCTFYVSYEVNGVEYTLELIVQDDSGLFLRRYINRSLVTDSSASSSLAAAGNIKTHLRSITYRRSRAKYTNFKIMLSG